MATAEITQQQSMWVTTYYYYHYYTDSVKSKAVDKTQLRMAHGTVRKYPHSPTVPQFYIKCIPIATL